MNKRCNGCEYKRGLTQRGFTGVEMQCCHYCLDTGNVRGTSAAECTHFTKRLTGAAAAEATRKRRQQAFIDFVYLGGDVKKLKIPCTEELRIMVMADG